MGYEELIKGLRADAEEKIRQLWKDVNEEAKRIREEEADRFDHMREEHRRRLETAARESCDNILADAERESRKIMAEAEKRLSDRLFSLAMASLGSLRNEEYEKVFSELAAEIYSLQWKEVRVASGDMELAKGLFPDARIVRDDGITGGLEVHSENGQISVTNTFEKRLERAWESMLPLIVQNVYKMVSDD
jgi:V/A-type H+-transporting ATPase subunit E